MCHTEVGGNATLTAKRKRDKAPKRLIASSFHTSRLNRDSALAVSAEAGVSTGEGVFSAGVMPGVAYMTLSIACLIAMEVVKRRLAPCRHRPTIAVMRVKAVVHMTIETVVAVEPWTSSNEYAADEPVGPVVAIGRAVIRSIVEIPIWAAGLNANTDSDLSRPQG
jgi:hypothetical protein